MGIEIKSYKDGLKEGREQKEKQIKDAIEKYIGDYRSLIANDIARELLKVIGDKNG